MRLLLPILALLPLPALAETDIRGMLIAMAKTNGCVLTEDQAEATFTAMGLQKEDVRPVAQAMIAAGEASVVDNRLRISDALCTGAAEAAPPAPAPAPAPALSPKMAAIVGVFNANGCLLVEDGALARFAAVGVTQEDFAGLGAEVTALMEAGHFTEYGDEANSIRMNPPLCTATTAAADPADPLIRLLRENGCALTQEEAEPLLSRYGMTMQAADEMADSLMDRGLAIAEEGRLVLQDCN